MSESAPPSSRQRRRKPRGFFVRGLAVVLPAVLTVFVFATVFDFVRGSVAAPINRSIYATLDGTGLGWSVLRGLGIDPWAPEYLLAREAQPVAIRDLYDAHLGQGADPQGSPTFLAALEDLRAERVTWLRDNQALGIDGEHLRADVRRSVGVWAGVLIAAAGVLFVGYLASGFLGRSAIATLNRLGSRLPVVRSVYPYTKQLVDFFLTDKELEFDTVVAAPYPSAGTWALGFVTGTGLKSLHQALDGVYLPVYVPSSPLPMTGYTIFIEAHRLVPLDLTVEEALRVLVTGGVVVPPAESVEGLQETMARLGVPPRSAEDPQP